MSSLDTTKTGIFLLSIVFALKVACNDPDTPSRTNNEGVPDETRIVTVQGAEEETLEM